MAFHNELFEAHRMHPVRQCKTIQLHNPAHVAHLRMGNDTIAHKLGLIHLGDNLFRVQRGRDLESVMQGVERVLEAFERAKDKANGAA